MSIIGSSLMLGSAANAGGFIEATGGTVTYDGDYAIHRFGNPGSFVFTVTTAHPGATAEVLVLAGAGGNGGTKNNINPRYLGGSGGAGGLIQSSAVIAVGTHTIVVGSYGTNGLSPNGTQGGNGGDSSAFGLVAIGGGGGGGGAGAAGSPGGSGGGGSARNTSATNPGYAGGAGTPGQGHGGGRGVSGQTTAMFYGGGGGGAGGVGGDATGSRQGTNGGGVISSITGSPVTYGTAGASGVVIIRYKIK